MGKLVQPQTFLVGYTNINNQGILDYLKYTNNEEFIQDINEAQNNGLSDAEILCSIFAKLCYKSLTLGQNKNITKTRNIESNIKACFDSGHGSVFEHVGFNFIITNCSRILTHELCRHRVGTAFSQTSGRYVRGDELDIVYDPILDPVKFKFIDLQTAIEMTYKKMVKELGLNNPNKYDFDHKKKLTSALRRILPNGQSNEIAFSVNLRAAEWEIRLVFNQIYNLLKDKFPLIFYGAKETEIDGLLEITEMRLQPYEKEESTSI